MRRPQARFIGDHGPRPPYPPGSEMKSRVVAPKTRIAVGIVFVGALIYSMVRFQEPRTESCIALLLHVDSRADDPF